MSYQVGAACYATVVDAGVAACAAYAPISTLVSNGAVIRTISCTSADAVTGALKLQITSTPVSGGASTIAQVKQVISYSPCVQSDYVAAAELIFAAILSVWAALYGVNAIRRYLDWSRGEA